MRYLTIMNRGTDKWGRVIEETSITETKAEGRWVICSQEIESVRLCLNIESSGRNSDPYFLVTSVRGLTTTTPFWDGVLASVDLIPAEIWRELEAAEKAANVGDRWYFGDAHSERYARNADGDYMLIPEWVIIRDAARARVAELTAQIDSLCNVFPVAQQEEPEPAAEELPVAEPAPVVELETVCDFSGTNDCDNVIAEEGVMIINLTQHAATADQIAAGVRDLTGTDRDQVIAALNFETLPTAADLADRAGTIALVAMLAGATKAMIGGAPYFMSHLEFALKSAGITPVYAFSRRESVEEAQVDGSVKKINIFRHSGFVEVSK